MKLISTRIYRGPHLHSLMPMVGMRLDIGELEHHPSNRLPNFVDRLLMDLPTLHEHGCCHGVPGGFVRRLHEGTWFGHIVEHVAIELQQLAGFPVTRGKTRSSGALGVYDILFSFEDEEVGVEAGQVALRYLRSILPQELDGYEPALPFSQLKEEFLAYAKHRHFGPSTKSLVDEAIRRDIPIRRLDGGTLQLGWGAAQRRIQATITENSSYFGVECAQDKRATARLLAECGLPVPQQSYACDAEEAVQAAITIGYPVVVKPADLSKGRGVGLNLSCEAEVRQAWLEAYEFSNEILVETYYPGRDYRILVVAGEVVAVAERVPAHVMGDGVSTIHELVDRENTDPRRGEGHENMLTRLVLDDTALHLLAETGYSSNTIPTIGEICFLRRTANLSTGGIAIDCTHDIHPDNRLIAIRAARQIGLDIAGIDIVCPDIAQSLYQTHGGIIEVNAAPGFRMHLAPSIGKPRNVAAPVIDSLFGRGNGRIPIVAITGTNGKTTVTKMVGHILQTSGKRVGVTSSDGIYIEGSRIAEGDCSGPQSARILLADRGIDAAVFETARGGLLREGLAFDRCDVGCVLNITSDHLGISGIDTIEQLANLKRVIVEAVSRNGTSVLNADDEHCRSMAEYVGGDLLWFSSEHSPFIRERMAAGDRAVILEQNGEIILYDREIQPVLLASSIPATYGGTATFNIQNALAAIGIAHGLGVPLHHIQEGLLSFKCSLLDNPGRCNVLTGLPFTIVIDYAHNEAALRAVSEFVCRQARRRTLAVLMSAGDRRDEDIQALGRIAAHYFDIIIAKEDTAKRGRLDGELMELIATGAAAAGMPDQAIFKATSEGDAIDMALYMAKPGDTLLFCLEEPNLALEKIDNWRKAREGAPQHDYAA